LVSAAAASAQQATVQMQYRDLSTTGNFVNSDEVLINGMACKQVKQVPVPKQNALPG
jgi:hypothetical protein